MTVISKGFKNISWPSAVSRLEESAMQREGGGLQFVCESNFLIQPHVECGDRLTVCFSRPPSADTSPPPFLLHRASFVAGVTLASNKNHHTSA